MSFIEEVKQSKAFKLIASYLGICFVILQVLDPLAERGIIEESLFRIIIYLIIAGIPIPLVVGFFSDRQRVKLLNKKPNLNVIISILAIFAVFYLSIKNIELRQSSERLTSLDENLEEIIEKFDEEDNYFVFEKTKELLLKFPQNKILKLYYEKSSYPISIETRATASFASIRYGKDTVWHELGSTPIKDYRVPWFMGQNDFQLRFSVGDRSIVAMPDLSGDFNFETIDKYPADHVIIPGTKNSMMFLPGIDFGDISIETFSISKTEVSNKEFQAFVNDGGYENSDFWDFPIDIGGSTYTYDKSIGEFVDKYGQYGPAGWSYGQFDHNTGNLPVTGISWFEARAYSRYTGKKLPNLFQWLYAAGLAGFVSELPDISKSNLKSSGLRSYDDSSSVNYFGIKNIAGNVREWVTNPQGIDRNKFTILGGSYLDNTYSFNNYHSISPFDRSVGNGFRVAQHIPQTDQVSLDDYVIDYTERDILEENDVSEDVFNLYREQFFYGEYDLSPKIDTLLDNPNYITYRFEISPPYENDEPLHGYVIYSNKYQNNLKPIIHFPSAWAIGSNADDWIISSTIKDYNYLLMEGYAVICPVYFSTYNREKTLKTWWANESDLYKNTIIKIGKDFRRSIDFIESRNEFDINYLSYIGYSWGSIMSNILLAIDTRVKSAFICAGGLQVQKSKPEIDPAIYARRVYIPVMHITGKNDGIFDFENSQLPMQKLLGTPAKDQEMIVLEGVGHAIPKDIRIKNHLRWLKKYNN